MTKKRLEGKSISFEELCGRPAPKVSIKEVFPAVPNYQKRFLDKTGQRQGALVFVSVAGKAADGTLVWLCQCDCDNKTIIRAGKRSKNQSCGCLWARKINCCPHPDRPHYGWGMCFGCYKKAAWAAKTPDEKRMDWTSGERKRREKMSPEEFADFNRGRAIKKRFGITKQDYAKMKQEQNNTCPCGNVFVPGKFTNAHIDHDHACCPQKTQCCGKCVRGLLCGRCNMVLGLLKEDVQLLPQYLVDFLRRYEARRAQTFV